jgi:hypothetical protein
MTVTSLPSGISTTFITFTSANMTVGWQTNNNGKNGNYTIKITGTIKAQTTWT